MLHRLNDQTHQAAARRGLQEDAGRVSNQQNLAVTCSGNFSAPAIMCAMATLGVDNVMFSVDWPYESNGGAVDFLKRLPLGASDLEKIAHGNAERILRL